MENLATLLAGWDAFQAGSTDVGKAMLSRDLDLLKVLDSKMRRQLTYWERLVNTPSRGDLVAAGLDGPQATLLRRAYRASAFKILGLFLSVSAYYTPPLHSVYTKRKHGYTLVDPRVSSLRLESLPGGAKDPHAAMMGGFAVVHRTRTERTLLTIVKSDEGELRGCMQAAANALSLANAVAGCWISQVEHQRSVSLSCEPPADATERASFLAALRLWIGDGFSGAYPVDEVFERLARGEPAT